MIAAATLPSVQCRDARFSDYEAIAALATRCGIPIEPREQWEDLWKANPAYRATVHEWPIGWVLENSVGTIVGYIGNIPLWYQFDGKRLLVATGRCWVVDSDYRGYAVLLLAEHFAQRNVDVFINNTVNAEAASAYNTFNVQKVPVGTWDMARFWITGHTGFAAAFLAKKKTRLAGVMRYLLAIALWAVSNYKHRDLNSASFSIESTGVGPEFDDFFAALSQRHPKRFMALRSREVLEWHFKYALREGSAWIFKANIQGNCRAYAVFCRADVPEIGLKRLRLIDFQSLDGTATALPPILSMALKRSRREGIHVVESIGFRPAGSTILEFIAPFSRKLPAWTFYYKAAREELARELENPAVWDPSAFDGDASL